MAVALIKASPGHEGETGMAYLQLCSLLWPGLPEAPGVCRPSPASITSAFPTSPGQVSKYRSYCLLIVQSQPVCRPCSLALELQKRMGVIILTVTYYY